RPLTRLSMQRLRWPVSVAAMDARTGMFQSCGGPSTTFAKDTILVLLGLADETIGEADRSNIEAQFASHVASHYESYGILIVATLAFGRNSPRFFRVLTDSRS